MTIMIPADGFGVPANVYRASRGGTARPTVLMFNGFDGRQFAPPHRVRPSTWIMGVRTGSPAIAEFVSRARGYDCGSNSGFG